jgi:bacterial/archaeal transporter family-2 protein
MWFLYLFAVLAGALNAIQAGANATLSKTLGQPFLAAILILAVSAAGFLVAGLAAGQLSWPEPSAWGRLPWWAWIGGLFGATVLASQLFVAQRVGAGPYVGLVVTAAVVMSLILDHFGLVGFEVHRVNPWRLLGAGLMIAGVGLVARF